jgi:hypothetical protein
MSRLGAIRWWHLLVLAGLAAGGIFAWTHRLLPASQPSGAIAIVDGASVSQLDVTVEAQSRGISADAIDPPMQKVLLSAVIDRKLLAAAAVKQGATSTPLFQASVARATEMLAAGTTAEQIAGPAREATVQEAQRYMAANPLMFGDRQIFVVDGVVADLRSAPARQFDPAKTIDDVLSSLRLIHIPYERANRRIDSATIPPDQAGRFAKLKNGELFRLPVGQNALVGAIIAREPKILPAGEQLAGAQQAVGQLQRDATLKAALTTLRNNANIKYVTGSPAS